MSNQSKKISLLSAIAISSTSMVGSGWLFSAQLNAKTAGNYAFVAWIVAALFVLCVGLCMAQVVAKYPVRGATTRSSSLSHNNIFGMPFAFANWFGIIVVVPTEAQATTQYLAAAAKSTILMDPTGLTVYGKLFALGILFLYLVVNYYGIRLLAKVNNVVTVFKIFAPIFAVVVFLIARFDTSNFTLASNANYGLSSAFTAIVGGGLIYSYNGFQLPASFASEIKNPKKNIARSMIISIVLVMLLYLLLQLSFMGAVPHDMIATAGWSALNFHSPLLNIALLLGLHFLSTVLAVDSMVSPSGTGYSYLGGSSRMFYAMAVAGQMPKWAISKLHPKYNLCRRSMLINWFIAALVLWNSDNWAALMLVVTGYHVVGYMAAPISMGAINAKTRIFGVVVFAVTGFVMATIPERNLIIINVSIMVLLLIYGIVTIRNKIVTLKHLLIFNLPIIAYLWSIYFLTQNLVALVVVSVVFYFFVTHPKYVTFCRSVAHADVDEETRISLN